MFTDKTRPDNRQQLSTVSTVSRFYNAPGVKKCDTVETVDSSYMPPPPKIYPDGYVIELRTATGTWYYSKSLFDWTSEISKSYIFAPYAEQSTAEFAQKASNALVAVFGPATIISVRRQPIRKVPIGRCEIIEEQL